MEVQPLTDKQAITIAGTLGITLLMNFEKHIPPHKRVARKIKAVETALIDLFTQTGEPVNEAILKWTLDCWDRAVLMAEEVPK